MVAVTLGLFMLIGLLSLIGSNSVSRTEFDKSSRQIENGRFALATLTEDIEHAGFTGATTQLASVTQAALTSATLCPATMTPAALGYASTPPNVPTVQVPWAIYSPSTAPACLTNYVAGTGILVVSRASTSTTTVGAAVANVAYLQPSGCATESTAFAVNLGSTASLVPSGFPLHASDCITAAPLRALVQRIYYVSSCNVCTPTSDNQPTLEVAEYGPTGAATITPLVEGIQDLQFDFGVDTDNNGSPDFYYANTNAYFGTSTTPTNWNNVMTVRIHVLARSEDPTGSWTDSRTYDMGLLEGTVPATAVAPCTSGFCDQYKRHVYSGVARLYNASGQREIQ